MICPASTAPDERRKGKPRANLKYYLKELQALIGCDLAGEARLNDAHFGECTAVAAGEDRKSTRLNSSHGYISYAVFCLKKKKQSTTVRTTRCALQSAYR